MGGTILYTFPKSSFVVGLAIADDGNVSEESQMNFNCLTCRFSRVKGRETEYN
jgi:hypothetical protein